MFNPLILQKALPVSVSQVREFGCCKNNPCLPSDRGCFLYVLQNIYTS